MLYHVLDFSYHEAGLVACQDLDTHRKLTINPAELCERSNLQAEAEVNGHINRAYFFPR